MQNGLRHLCADMDPATGQWGARDGCFDGGGPGDIGGRVMVSRTTRFDGQRVREWGATLGGDAESRIPGEIKIK